MAQAEEGEQSAVHRVFLLDSYKGRIWMYQPAFQSQAAKQTVPESFVPIGIGEPVVGAPGFGLREAPEN